MVNKERRPGRGASHAGSVSTKADLHTLVGRGRPFKNDGSSNAAARLLGVPQGRPKRKALADRLPHLQAGGRAFSHVPTAERPLVESATSGLAKTGWARHPTGDLNGGESAP